LQGKMSKAKPHLDKIEKLIPKNIKDKEINELWKDVGKSISSL